MRFNSLEFPKTIADVSVAWLNNVLPVDQAVCGFSCEPLDEQLQGAISLTFVLTLEFSHRRHDVPSLLLVKFSPDDPQTREAIRPSRAYERETDFYRELGQRAGMPIPQCYAQGYDGTDNCCMLLMEFIDHSSVRDVINGTVDEVRTAVMALAGLHASWWGRTGDLPFLVREDQGEFLEQRIGYYQVALDEITAHHRDKVGDTIVALLQAYIPWARQLAEEGATGPLTLCHGDYHRKQMLFPDNERGRFAVLDWQTATADRGACDLARIIVVGLRNEQRRQHETALVEHYHRLLVEQGIDDYPLELLWQHYYLGVIRVLLLHSLCFAGLFDYQPLVEEWRQKGQDWFEVFFKWPSEAVIDHDIVAYLQQLTAGLQQSDRLAVVTA